VKRQYRSFELKRRIVEESLVPGASVARIARAHGVNANQVFAWRQKYQRGLLSEGRSGKPGLLPVRVVKAGAGAGAGQEEVAPWGNPRTSSTPSGSIQIRLAKGTVHIIGSADVEALRTALEILARWSGYRQGPGSGS
jgi:transposase